MTRAKSVFQEYVDFSASFVNSHRDVLLADFREPHNRFIEREIWDNQVHGSLLAYELGEVRLRSEALVQREGLTRSADVPTQVSSEEDAVASAHARASNVSECATQQIHQRQKTGQVEASAT